MKKISLLCLMGIAFGGFSQNTSGYLGRQLSIGGDFNFMPTFTNQNKNGKKGLFHFNDQIGLSAEYTINRHASIMLEANYYTTLKNYKHYYPDISYTSNEFDNSIHSQLDVQSYNIEYRIYKNSISPLGKYFGFLLNYKTMDLTQAAIFQTGVYKEYRPINRSPFSMLSFGVDYGNQRIIANHLVLEYGIKAIMPFKIFKIIGHLAEVSTRYNYEEISSISRAGLHDLFNFKIGLRYLIF